MGYPLPSLGFSQSPTWPFKRRQLPCTSMMRMRDGKGICMQFLHCYQNLNQQTYLGAWEWWKILPRVPLQRDRPAELVTRWQRDGGERPAHPSGPTAATSTLLLPETRIALQPHTPWGAECPRPCPPSRPGHPWASTQSGHEELRRTVFLTTSHFFLFAEFTSTHVQMRRLVCRRKKLPLGVSP